MKNNTTFETASALKQAGFPQPEPEPGQVWYDGTKTPCIVLETETDEFGDVFVNFWSGYERGCLVSIFLEKMIFAHGPADILRELGCHYELSFGDDFKWWASKDFGARSEKNYIHDNPAEACALAWLELKR